MVMILHRKLVLTGRQIPILRINGRPGIEKSGPEKFGARVFNYTIKLLTDSDLYINLVLYITSGAGFMKHP